MPIIVNPKLDLANPTACPTLHTASNNTIVLEVDNLLAGWPSYLIKYTPPSPGETVNLILRLKDVKKYIWVDNESDSDDDGMSSTEIAKRNMLREKERAATIAVDLTDSTYQNPATTPPIVVNAIPVRLEGILKDPEPVRLGVDKFVAAEQTTLWPPRWPRGFRDVSPDISTTLFTALKTFPVDIKAVGNDTSTT